MMLRMKEVQCSDRFHTGKDVDGALAQFQAVVEVPGLEMGGPHDRQPHADGAGEDPGLHGDGLLVPCQGGLRVLLQVAEDFGGIGGQGPGGGLLGRRFVRERGLRWVW
ncbi:hypothetical protein ACWCZ5_32680 [Streptomyces sp. NPDC001667]